MPISPYILKRVMRSQFDWSEEPIVLGGMDQRIKVAHFRLCHSRKSFVVAYPGESQEMVLDAFVRALAFYGGVPRRVIIDNPKTMVTYVSRSKDRVYHPRFLALMNHYVMEPVACTPASGWEKGQIENQVQHIRQWLFTPKLDFEDLDALNAWLSLRCNELGSRPHPDQKDQTIDAVFAVEQVELRPLGVGFDGYVEKAVRVRSTCLVQYDSNRYSVPAQYAGRHISLRACAGRIVLVADQKSSPSTNAGLQRISVHLCAADCSGCRPKNHRRAQTQVYKEYQLLRAVALCAALVAQAPSRSCLHALPGSGAHCAMVRRLWNGNCRNP